MLPRQIEYRKPAILVEKTGGVPEHAAFDYLSWFAGLDSTGAHVPVSEGPPLGVRGSSSLVTSGGAAEAAEAAARPRQLGRVCLFFVSR
jgi:hypothetical protein